jgi:hypothetical protein
MQAHQRRVADRVQNRLLDIEHANRRINGGHSRIPPLLMSLVAEPARHRATITGMVPRKQGAGRKAQSVARDFHLQIAPCDMRPAAAYASPNTEQAA